MSVIYALIPVAIIFVIIAIAIFFWAVRSDQFEDIERQGLNILMDDDKPKNADNKAPNSQANKEQESDNDAKR
ncbi:cbb3-type cytochrome oxidase assembly protein CcoS [Idiomarina sp. UBA4520]|uniref:cbb3-type cytochrome oxidase assembly protein CcoS n=1 Tax=Idiomarina sp. UBA4520 TaxID=1946647 RepID=UPI000A79DFCB|nr:cbb3-type cytochrome oxidase assembly protein CcoS [Idiomarina sp. UBA4520]MBF38102.1 cbb3-type cytochrome oxidase assembly protein CcoS [Idiomarinaceae bacterium]|tara:strand:- start:2701 stop:2919 length:219 start_codon:yes stop_codon:yes gene_type:complete